MDTTRAGVLKRELGGADQKREQDPGRGSMPCAADREPRGGGPAAGLWCHGSRWEETAPRSGWTHLAEQQCDWRGRSQGQSSRWGGSGGRAGFGLGLGKGHERAGTVLVCYRLFRPLLMETVLLDYVEVPEDGCFLKLTDMS